MKLLKPIFFIFSLSLAINSFAKIYIDDLGQKPFGDKNFPVLDVLVVLNRLYFDGRNWTFAEKNDYLGGSSRILLSGQIKEEITITSPTLIRNFLNKSKEEQKPLSEKEKKLGLIHTQSFSEVLKLLSDKSKWLNFKTADEEFVIMIPIKKYPEIKSINDLEKIGLNSQILLALDKIDDNFYKSSEKKQIEYIEQVSKENPSLKTKGAIKLETLLNIFSNTQEGKKIAKRIYLAGHGCTDTSKTMTEKQGPVEIKKPTGDESSYVAQLSPLQYVEFLNYLQKINTSFLYVDSCYSGGWNALALQSASFYEQNNIFKKFEESTKNISYIVIVKSSPDTASVIDITVIPIYGYTSTFFTSFLLNNFFIDLNDFFLKQKTNIIEFLENKNKKIKAENENIEILNKKLQKEKHKQKNPLMAIPNPDNISEVDILNGKYITSKIFDPKTGNLIEKENVSLINQNPKLINYKIKKITDNICRDDSSNFQAIKFPGRPFFRALIKESSDLQEKDLFEQDFIRIDYPFILKRHIEGVQGAKETPTIELKTSGILIYPSITNLSIKLLKPKNIVGATIKVGGEPPVEKIASMIAGRAQHYIEELIFDKSMGKNLDNFTSTFILLHHYATKLFFIKKLSFENEGSRNIFHNFVLKISAGNVDYLYQDNSRRFYSKSGKQLESSEAKKIIKKWIMETTPAKEAIHEATAGIENIYKFRIKISQITGFEFHEKGIIYKKHQFEDMFTKQELGRKASTGQKQNAPNAQGYKPAPIVPDKPKRPAPPVPPTKPAPGFSQRLLPHRIQK